MKTKFEGFDEEEEAFLRSITSIGNQSTKKTLKNEDKSQKIPEVPKNTIKLSSKPTLRQRRFTSDEKLLDLLEVNKNSISLEIDGSIAVRQNNPPVFQIPEQVRNDVSQSLKQDSSIGQISINSEYKKATEILQDKMLEEKRKIKVANIGKKVEKNIFKQIRYTSPKKRNIIGKMLLQRKLKRGFYDDIEFEYDHIGQNKIDKAKNSNTKEGKRFYREVQEYEDAIQDVETRNGWRAFKIGLATLMLSASLIAVNKIPQNIDEIKNNTTQTEVNKNNDEKIDEEQIRYFKGNVKNYDGYEFDFLTDNELFSTKNKLAEIGNKLSKSTYEVVRTGNGDQEFLDSLVQKASGSEYESFSDEQKRDYRQLAYEVLRINCSTVFNPTETCIRNPIVWDVLQAKERMKRKGYYSDFIINADQQEHLKIIGGIMHIENTTDLIEYQKASLINKGQDLLDNIIKEASDERYESLSKTAIRDYKQIAYELLPAEVKDLFIKDPIDIDKSLEGYEYGE